MGSCWRATALCSSRSADCIEYCDVARTPTESRVRARSAFSAKPQDADLAVTRERLRGTLPVGSAAAEYEVQSRRLDICLGSSVVRAPGIYLGGPGFKS
jgi:hypothetical protein